MFLVPFFDVFKSEKNIWKYFLQLIKIWVTYMEGWMTFFVHRFTFILDWLHKLPKARTKLYLLPQQLA